MDIFEKPKGPGSLSPTESEEIRKKIYDEESGPRPNEQAINEKRSEYIKKAILESIPKILYNTATNKNKEMFKFNLVQEIFNNRLQKDHGTTIPRYGKENSEEEKMKLIKEAYPFDVIPKEVDEFFQGSDMETIKILYGRDTSGKFGSDEKLAEYESERKKAIEERLKEVL